MKFDFKEILETTDFKELVKNILAGIAILGVVTAPFWGTYLCYTLNTAKCVVWVGTERVYTGRCYFVDVDSVGANGNSKKVSIYSDIWKLHKTKFYVAEDVEIFEDTD